MDLGDIVQARGLQWVIAEFHGNPFGTRNARLARLNSVDQPAGDNAGAQFLDIEEAALVFVSTPTWAAGQRVLVGDRVGSVQSGASVEGCARVLLDQDSKYLGETIKEFQVGDKPRIRDPLRKPPKPYSVRVEAAPADVPKWKLVLENVKL